MQFVALLRGINVGGKNKIQMAKLKSLFENLGFQDVKTYINSGNVIFNSSKKDQIKFCMQIEEAIQKEFGFPVPTIIKSTTQLQSIAKAIPQNWQNNSEVKCDVLFLWDEVDSPKTLKLLNLNPEIEDYLYTPGAIIWRIDREKVTKSKVTKMVGTDLYKKLTIRNCNTVRKLLSLAQSS